MKTPMRTGKKFKITVLDEANKPYAWYCQHLSGVASTLGRKMNGWSFWSHDGTERFVEGNWHDLVPAFRLTVNNYGMKTNLS